MTRERQGSGRNVADGRGVTLQKAVPSHASHLKHRPRVCEDGPSVFGGVKESEF